MVASGPAREASDEGCCWARKVVILLAVIAICSGVIANGVLAIGAAIRKMHPPSPLGDGLENAKDVNA